MISYIALNIGEAIEALRHIQNVHALNETTPVLAYGSDGIELKFYPELPAIVIHPWNSKPATAKSNTENE